MIRSDVNHCGWRGDRTCVNEVWSCVVVLDYAIGSKAVRPICLFMSRYRICTVLHWWTMVNSWALCLSVPLKKKNARWNFGKRTRCKVKYHGWIFECIFVYKTGLRWMNLLVGPLAVGTPWSTICPQVPPEQLVFVRWPGGEEVAELVPKGATAPKVNTKRRDLDSKSLADLVEISLNDEGWWRYWYEIFK